MIRDSCKISVIFYTMKLLNNKIEKVCYIFFSSFQIFTMHLYNLTLQRSTGIVAAIHGNFSGSKLQEIVLSRGKVIELLRHDPNTGKMYLVLSIEVFGVVRSLMPFRLTGGTKGEFTWYRTRIFLI